VDNAAEIRELINTRLKELKDSGLGDHDDQLAPARPAMGRSSLLLTSPLREILREATALRETVARIDSTA
jgi:hypothetical protein